MPADHTALKVAAFNVIAAQPHPITKEAALAAAKGVLPAKEYGDFVKWFDVNGDTILRRLNG